MVTVWLLVQVDLTPTEEGQLDPDKLTACKIAQEAISDALKRQQANGFNHDFDSTISMMVEQVEASGFTPDSNFLARKDRSIR